MAIALSLSLTVGNPTTLAKGGLPAGAILLNGKPVTLNGKYITLNSAGG